MLLAVIGLQRDVFSCGSKLLVILLPLLDAGVACLNQGLQLWQEWLELLELRQSSIALSERRRLLAAGLADSIACCAHKLPSSQGKAENSLLMKRL